MTWKHLIDEEPRLKGLELDALAASTEVSERFCRNAHWYGDSDQWPGLNPRYELLVGCQRGRDPAIDWVDDHKDREARMAADATIGHGFLWSSEAYDIGYAHLYSLLPDCRGCECW